MMETEEVWEHVTLFRNRHVSEFFWYNTDRME